MKCEHKDVLKKYGEKTDSGVQEFFYICKTCKKVIIKKKPAFNMDNVKKQ